MSEGKTADNAQPAQSRYMRPFFVVWTGQAFSLLGSQLVGFALVWWLTETTGSATWSAVTAMSPLGLAIAGPVADALSPQLWFLIAGTALAAAGVGGFFVPALMRIEDGIGPVDRASDVLASNIG